jgi:protein-L-isoaspartate(D-aspartate) O-methyltransferase
MNFIHGCMKCHPLKLVYNLTTMFNLFIPAILIMGLFTTNPQNTDFGRLREDMVKRQIIARGVQDNKVLSAMRKVPRHLFVPESQILNAYNDVPLPIGENQTISQPYIVAYMTEILRLNTDDKVLEIGTGSGYQAAILAEIVKEVYTVEIIPVLAERAEKVLKSLGYKNIHIKTGDGYKGWAEYAPYDAVIVTAAPNEIPEDIIYQLKEGGKIIIPVGPSSYTQTLILGVKKNGKIEKQDTLPVRFVPMVRDNK